MLEDIQLPHQLSRPPIQPGARSAKGTSRPMTDVCALGNAAAAASFGLQQCEDRRAGIGNRAGRGICASGRCGGQQFGAPAPGLCADEFMELIKTASSRVSSTMRPRTLRKPELRGSGRHRTTSKRCYGFIRRSVVRLLLGVNGLRRGLALVSPASRPCAGHRTSARHPRGA